MPRYALVHRTVKTSNAMCLRFGLLSTLCTLLTYLLTLQSTSARGIVKWVL